MFEQLKVSLRNFFLCSSTEKKKAGDFSMPVSPAPLGLYFNVTEGVKDPAILAARNTFRSQVRQTGGFYSLFYKVKRLFLSIVGRWRLWHGRTVCLFLSFASTVSRQTFTNCCQQLRARARNPPLHILHWPSAHLTSTCLSLLQLVTWAIPFRVLERLGSLKSFPPQLPKWSFPHSVCLLQGQTFSLRCGRPNTAQLPEPGWLCLVRPDDTEPHGA